MKELVQTISEHPYASFALLLGICAIFRELGNLIEVTIHGKAAPEVNVQLDEAVVAENIAKAMARGSKSAGRVQ